MNGHRIHTCSFCFLGPHSVWYEEAGGKKELKVCGEEETVPWE